MIRKVIVTGVGVLLLLLVVHFIAHRGKPALINLPPAATGPWVAFGDSLTSGYGAESGHDYPSVLGKLLGMDIKNLGVPGQTTQDGLSRVGVATQLHPRVVLLCLGGNDGLQELPREQMFKNLGEMIDRFHQSGSFVVLIGIRSTTLRDKNTKGFEELAEQKQVLLVPDILEGVMGKSNLMSDYVHPNDEGYRIIAERLQTVLSPYLVQLR